MAKAEKPESDAVPAPVEQPLTADEFCRRLSVTDRRVELISGFRAHCRATRLDKTTDAAFRKAYAEFCTRPA